MGKKVQHCLTAFADKEDCENSYEMVVSIYRQCKFITYNQVPTCTIGYPCDDEL